MKGCCPSYRGSWRGKPTLAPNLASALAPRASTRSSNSMPDGPTCIPDPAWLSSLYNAETPSVAPHKKPLQPSSSAACSCQPRVDRQLAFGSPSAPAENCTKQASTRHLQSRMQSACRQLGTHLTSRRAGGSKARSRSSSGQSYITRNAKPDLPIGNLLCSLSTGRGRNCIKKQTMIRKHGGSK